MSPGVATPWPAAPPIPIAKVCFIAPSLTERPAARHALAHDRAQKDVWFSAEVVPPACRSEFYVWGEYTPNGACINRLLDVRFRHHGSNLCGHQIGLLTSVARLEVSDAHRH